MGTDRGLERLITFLDAVVAIAITLLVLPLVDVVASEGAEQTASALLQDHLDEVGGFLLSFVIIARLWMAHHRVLEHAAGYDALQLWLNVAWALSIVVLPFATQLITTYGEDRLALGIYLGTMFAGSLALTAIAFRIDRVPGLRRDLAAGDALAPWRAARSALAFGVALVLGLAIPGVGYFGLLALALDGRIAHLVDRRREAVRRRRSS